MKYRHEVKCEISEFDFCVLRQRLRAVMHPDPYARDGVYKIRSLYFDTLEDKALREKLDGVAIREKWRIRYYNGDTSVIKLERKLKDNSLGNKQSTRLTREQAEKIVSGDIDWMAKSEDGILLVFYSRLKSEGLRPRTIVDYTREPFVFSAGNVRVTLDYGIRTGLGGTDFLSPDCPTVPISPSPIIMEVKWDEFLPDIIRNVVQLDSRRSGAFSKYASSRMYD